MKDEGDPTLISAGFRFGGCGTHGSRTMMLAELRELLAAVPNRAARRVDYTRAIVEENVLDKATASNRRITDQRLGELYALDPTVPLFRGLRVAWDHDLPGRPLIALLAALARDPLLRATSALVLHLSEGEELGRTDLLRRLRDHVETRMNDASLEKVARNVASTWSQSGHLEGRVRKHRRRVAPTPGAMALALWLGTAEGRVGEDLLHSPWTRVLDADRSALVACTLEARRLGLVKASIAADVVQIDVAPLLGASAGA